MITLELDDRKVLNKVTNDRFGLLISHEWKRLIDPYTPRDIGTLSQNVVEMPFALHYKEPYAHYQYEGIVYVDPKYNVGGFYDPMYGWWSRPGVTKIPTSRPLQYSTAKNPFATDHWDVKAANAGQADKLCRTINAALESGRF